MRWFDKYVHPHHGLRHRHSWCSTAPPPETSLFKSLPIWPPAYTFTSGSHSSALSLKFRLAFSRVSFKQNRVYVLLCLASCAQRNVWESSMLLCDELSIQLVVHATSCPFLFITEQCFVVWLFHTVCLSILVTGIYVVLRLWYVMNTAIMSICVQSFMWTKSLHYFEEIPGSSMAESLYVSINLTF